MKKNLLLAAVLLTGSASVALAQTDITPSGYNWNETGKLPAISSTYIKGSNPSAPAFTSWGGETEYDNGLIGIDGANNDNFNPAAIIAGTSIVDLGGEVGKCLAIRGAKCENVESAVKEATGSDVSIAKMSASTTWFDLNFFTDPSNTPTSSALGSSTELATDCYIHVKMVFNLYTDDQTSTQDYGGEVANITNILCSSNQNGLKPQGGVTGGSIYAYNFFVPETEGEYAGYPAYDGDGNAQWDPTRWMVYEFDTWAPQPEADGTSYTPLRVKLSCNGWDNFATETLFIKELSFTQCSGTPTVDCYTTASKTYETLSLGASEGIANAVNATENANAPKYNIAGKRVNDSFKGVVIQNGQKTIVR